MTFTLLIACHPRILPGGIAAWWFQRHYLIGQSDPSTKVEETFAVLNRLALALQESIVDDDAFKDAMAVVAVHFGCLSGALIYVDERRPGSTVEIGHGVLDQIALARYRETYAAEDPAPATMARLSVGQVTTTGRIFDIEDPKYERFREEFYYPLGLREAMGGPVIKEKGRFGVFAVQRGVDRPPFTEGECGEFAQIVPHVASALTLRRKFFELKTVSEALRGVLDDDAVASMVFDGEFTLRHANRASRRILARNNSMSLTSDGRLRLHDGLADNRLRQFVSLKDAKDRLVTRLPRSDNAVPYVFRASRSAEKTHGFVIKISDPLSTYDDARDILMKAFGMSAGSARLTTALLNGQTMAEYAATAGYSLNTAKYHLQVAFASTSTNRQSDLVRIAGSVVRDLSDGRLPA